MWFFVVLGALVVLYLVAIIPRMWNRPDKIQLFGQLYAHRGLHDNESGAPENSMAAFAKAVENGYGIELDVQLTKDFIPVVFHDFTLQRVCGAPGKVCDYTYEELQAFSLCKSEEKIPKFADFLALVGGKVPLIIEYKIEWADSKVCEVVDALLREYQGPYCIESFNPCALWWYRKNRPEVIRGQLSTNYAKDGKLKGKPLYLALQHLLFNFGTKPDFIAYEHRFMNNLSFQLATKLWGALAVAWTIRSEEELKRARSSYQLFIFDSFVPAEKK